MKLSFGHYNEDLAPSIKALDPIELPDLSVVTGVNGSGKTHLLKAISSGSITVQDIQVDDIILYDLSNFRVTDALIRNSGHAKNILNATRNAWTAFSSVKNSLKQAYDNTLARVGWTDQDDNSLEEKKYPARTIWEIYDEAKLSEGGDECRAVTSYVSQVRQILVGSGAFRTVGSSSIKDLLKFIRKHEKAPHLLTREDFKSFLSLSSEGGQYDLISTVLSTRITKYYADRFLWAHREFESRNEPITIDHLYSEFENEHEKPWKKLREAFAAIRTYGDNQSIFRFDITEPEPPELTLENWENYSFHTKLFDIDSNEPRLPKSLSSGEQVLLALVVAIIEANDGMLLPRLVLLDEVDATLHPSMVKALLVTIQNVLISRGSKVILATHSPSTVALAPEGSVYVLQKGQPSLRIDPKPNKEALEMLTEGYMTLDSGLATISEIAKHEITIISEGNNCKYLQRYLENIGVLDVYVLDKAIGSTSDSKLATLFEFFAEVGMPKPVLFIWDPDYKSKYSEKNNVYGIVLKCNPLNTLTKGRGIESLFADELLEGFTKEIKGFQGNCIRSFDEKSKRELEQHILQRNKPEDFSMFESVAAKLDEIRAENAEQQR